MLKTLVKIGSLAGVLALAPMGHSQAMPTATANGGLQVGAGYTYALTDYGIKNIQGVTGFADFDFRRHLGVEADAHYIALVTPSDLAENTYLAGPRFILPHGRFNLYAKGLVGIGDLVIQEQADNHGRLGGTYFAYALGGGLDYRATHHWVIRIADFEYQHWSYATGLTPSRIHSRSCLPLPLAPLPSTNKPPRNESDIIALVVVLQDSQQQDSTRGPS